MYCILVIYNKSVLDSPSYNVVSKTKSMHVIVCDNSTQDKENAHIVSQDGHTYIDMHGNQGLSKAYNCAIDWLLEHAKREDYVLLLDDDTLLDGTYLTQVTHAIQSKKDIYIPQVMADATMISPCAMHHGIVRPLKDLSNVDCNALSAINSGMVVSMRVYQNVRYNEDLFLDYVDHAFLKDSKKMGASIDGLDATLHQDFSALDTHKESLLHRFDIFKKDSKVFYSKVVPNRWSYLYVVGKRKLRLSIQCKDIRILFR